jgi:hypothetical protein
LIFVDFEIILLDDIFNVEFFRIDGIFVLVPSAIMEVAGFAIRMSCLSIVAGSASEVSAASAAQIQP